MASLVAAVMVVDLQVGMPASNPLHAALPRARSCGVPSASPPLIALQNDHALPPMLAPNRVWARCQAIPSTSSAAGAPRVRTSIGGTLQRDRQVGARGQECRRAGAK